MYFDELPISDELLDGLDAMNFQQCTPIQEQAIPPILEGRDIIACAQTGTGKTAAYILPLLDNLLTDGHDPNAINAIIMAPTRELAQQIDQQMEGFSYFLPFSSVAIYGGNDGLAWTQQSNGLRRGADVVIATPGRLISHINLNNSGNKGIDFSKVRYFILDEADRMLDMGFFDDIMTIAKELPDDRQTIMFSATMPQELRRIARTLMHDPVEINIAISRPPETISQRAYICHETQKLPILIRQLKAESLNKVILFVGKKKNVRDIYLALKKEGIGAAEMHSDLPQAERDKVMLDFRNGKIGVLVATDIVARGIDVDDIPLVINYDVPRDVEDYVHRIGRTARAENSGIALTLVSQADQRFFHKIETFLKKDIDKLPVPEELGEAPQYAPRELPQKKRQSRFRSMRSSRSQHKPNSSGKGNGEGAKRQKSRYKRHKPTQNKQGASNE